jgi:cell division protein FtsW
MKKQSVFWLLLVVASLAALGIVMLWSTSPFAEDKRGDPHYFINRQMIWLGIGLCALVVGALTDSGFWRKTWWVWFAGAFVLLLLCFVPPVGLRINGASRWIRLGPLTLQPSEVAKFAFILYVAWWYSRFADRAKEFRFGFLYPGLGALALMIPIALEVDMGTTALLGALLMAVMFLSGVRAFYLGGLVAAGLAAVTAGIHLVPERMGRLLAFIDPENHPKDYYQTLQSLIALGSGGVFGVGLGDGRQKMQYLPYAHTDCIFPVIGEELGMVATLGVVFLFLAFAMCGTAILWRVRDRFALLLGAGLLLMVSMQAAANIGITIGVLPNKGLPLPFISYGGSNLAFCLFAVGILINLFRRGEPERQAPRLAMRLAARTTPRL